MVISVGFKPLGSIGSVIDTIITNSFRYRQAQ
jgi:hypothetical protein